jgi:formylglycine-generating enzyme required for sulfatase activity
MKKFLPVICLLIFCALAATAAQDCFVKKGTWRESLIASREALFKQETQADNAEFAKAGITLTDWHYMSVGNDYRNVPKDFLQLKTTLDVNKPLSLKGAEYRWAKLPNVKPGLVHDITKLIDVEKSQYFFLTATITVPRDLEKGPGRYVAYSSARGWMTIKGGHQARAPRDADGRIEINNAFMKLPEKKGAYPVLALVDLTRNALPYFWYQPRIEDSAKGTDRSTRAKARAQLLERVAAEFNDPRSTLEMNFDRSVGIWPESADWVPGDVASIKNRYKQQRRLEHVKSIHKELHPTVQTSITPVLEQLDQLDDNSLQNVAQKFVVPSIFLELDRMVKSFASVKLAIKDQMSTFKTEYPNGEKYLSEIGGIERDFQNWIRSASLDESRTAGAFAEMYLRATTARHKILLDNPLLKFEKLLVASGGIRLASNWTGACGMGKKLQVLSPVSPGGELTTIHNGNISSYELDWEATSILFSDGSTIQEIDVDGTNLRKLKGPDKEDSSKRYNPCRMPCGDIMFVSTACEHAVPCTGGGGVGNMHVMDRDGNNERRITYDQDHNWDPCVLNNGRVVYARWEYTDLPHYFSRLLMSMNPDGTDQKEYYGSASYWPNAQYWTRPIPGHPTKIVTIVSGHHGVSRMGEMHILDPALGRHEADGSVQQVPGYGKKVEPIIRDNLVGPSWPKFITPYPLGTSPQEDGAGTYFLASVKMEANDPWRLCLVDIFDNITPILEGDYAMPVPLLPRKKPPVKPSRVNLAKKTGNTMIMDIYQGPGLKGYPRGSIKALRVGTYHYRFPGNGDTYATSHEGAWDIRRIMGTVPVYKDGSAFFEVPANTPIFVQPLDADGQALQVMRSWFSVMPGEDLSCIGCHEDQNMVPPPAVSIAARKAPSKITPWNGPMRGFSFDRELQPVLDRKCVGCHDGKKPDRPDFRAKRLHKDFTGHYSPAYMALQKYVRRAGLENDWHTPVPGEYKADTSHLVKLLKKGHRNVRLTRDEWERLYTWIDFNIPYPSNWQESHRLAKPQMIEKREQLLKLYAKVDDRIESTELPLPPIAKYEAPPRKDKSTPLPALEGWPLETGDGGQEPGGGMELELGSDLKIKLVKVPVGRFIMGDEDGFDDEKPRVTVVEKPFYMAATEVSLEQYHQFDPTHENGFVTTRRKDQSKRGAFCMDQPNLPVVRISFNQAMAFCKWLSVRTGKDVTLPTEQQWEWACRAGSSDKFYFGELKKDAMNIADEQIAAWNYGRKENGYSDRDRYTADVASTAYKPNAWGLQHMLGNVAEWTTSDYKPLPDVGVVKGTESVPYKVVRGGSWNDTARFATSASRWRYPTYQPPYDVGFRVIVRDKGAAVEPTMDTQLTKASNP